MRAQFFYELTQRLDALHDLGTVGQVTIKRNHYDVLVEMRRIEQKEGVPYYKSLRVVIDESDQSD